MKSVFYVSNALDDETRLERRITTDSPAASRKVFMLCRALNQSGVQALVISMGRGRQDGSWRYFPRQEKEVGGVQVIYLPFLHAPVLSELLSLFSLGWAVLSLGRFGSFKRDIALLFYNRLPVYLLGLTLARLLDIRTILDLEDGKFGMEDGRISLLKSRLLRKIFDFFCSGGAVLACSALEGATHLRPTMCCYGTSPQVETPPEKGPRVRVLLGGTLSGETGAPLLASAIRTLRDESPEWAKDLQFDISGQGESLESFQALARETKSPRVVVHGRLDSDAYRALLEGVSVGLALKPVSGDLAHTTFPSKVIELAAHGILVISTDISDVRQLLTEGALYLAEDNPALLVDRLKWVVENHEEVRLAAIRGKDRVDEICAPAKVGQSLGRFLLEEPAGRR